jgi:hypothetical protein
MRKTINYIPIEILSEIIQKALVLDENVPYVFKTKR